MGMDVYGHAPESEVGEYFRANIWHWRPLANYVISHFPQMVGDSKLWLTNDGYGLNGEQSKALGKAIIASIEAGAAQRAVSTFREMLSELPMQECRWCNSTGIRNDEVGKNAGFPNVELTQDLQVITGRTHGYCNACQGYGRVEDTASWYRLDIEDIEEFAEFLMDCGGFSIS